MSGPSHWLACAHMLRGDIAEGLVAQGSFNPAETVCFFFKAGTPSAGLGANRSNRKIGNVNEILIDALDRWWQTLIDALDRWEIDPVTAVCLKKLGIMSMTTGAVGTIPRSHLIRPVTFLNKWSLNMQYPTQVFTTTCNCREYVAMFVISRNAAITCVFHHAAAPSFCGLVF